MTTFRAAGGGSPSVTTWGYDQWRGLLTSKTDAASKAVTYSCTDGGRLKTRTWARGKHTRYDYDAAMQLTSTRYFATAAGNTGSNAGNDPVTGDVSLVYDRLGRTTTRGTGYKTGIPGLYLTSVYDATNLTLTRDSLY